MSQKWAKRDQAQIVALLRRQGMSDDRIADMLLNPMLEAFGRLLPSDAAAGALERAAQTLRAGRSRTGKQTKAN